MDLNKLEPWQFDSAFNDLPLIRQEDLARGILDALAKKGYEAHRVDKFDEVHTLADELLSRLEEATELLEALLHPDSFEIREEYLSRRGEAELCIEEWKKSFELYQKNLEHYSEVHEQYVE